MAAKTEFDEATFRDMYDLYWSKLYAYALRILLSQADAQDVVQQVFVSLWERRFELELENVEAYLIKAVKFACLASIRKAIKQEHLDEINVDQIISNDSCDAYSLAKDLKLTINGILSSLKKDDASILRMRLEDGMDNHEIAATLMLSEKTIRNKFSLTLAVVRKKLQSYGLEN